MSELSCCPWCGCAAVIESFQPSKGDREIFGRCYSPVCWLPGPSRKTEAEAIDAWNHWLVIAKRTVCPDLSGGGGT